MRSCLVALTCLSCLAGCTTARTPDEPSPTSPALPASAAASPAHASASPTNAPAAPPAIAKERFTEELASVVCAELEPCCRASGVGLDAATCRGKVVERTRKMIEAHPHYAAEHAEACLGSARERARACHAGADLLVATSCQRLFQGDRAPSEPCEVDDDCRAPEEGSAFCWKGALAKDAGRCAVTLPARLDAPCMNMTGEPDPKQLVFSACEDSPELFCEPKSRTCRPRAGRGAACSDDSECKDASCVAGSCATTLGRACATPRDCARGQACAAKKCVEGGKAGEPCERFSCAKGFFCHEPTARCMTTAAMSYCSVP
ncbi:MAG: hypothetical protein IT373_04365 [Polyangiaceae bacterium]|nr:hypothetical protein [Polyangiaceae bacterium]